MSLVRVVIAFPHLLEHVVQFLEGVLAVGFDPVDEHVPAILVLFNSLTFENGVESFLCVRLDDELLVLHELGQSLQNHEGVEALTEGF